MEGFYLVNGLINKEKCMYCLEDLNVEEKEETADHFSYWCEVTPVYIKRAARIQWEWVEKLEKAGWNDEGKSLGLNPPSLLCEGDARPGRTNRKKRR